MVNGRNGRGDCEDEKSMKNVMKFIVFLIYTIGIFFLQNPLVMLWGIGINLICMLVQQISIKKAWGNLWAFMGFILFTGVINIWVVDISYGATIAIKLMIVCNMTYLFANSMTQLEFAETIAKMMSPLKIVKVDTERIVIMIVIALSFIPILKQELENIRLGLKAKACKTDAFHLILHAKWILLPMLISILKRMDEMEYGLKAKAYSNE